MPIERKEWDFGYGITIKINSIFLDKVWKEFSTKHTRQRIDRDKAEMCMAKMFNLIILYLKEGISVHDFHLGSFLAHTLKREKRIKTERGFTRLFHNWNCPKFSYTNPTRKLFLKRWNKQNKLYQLKNEKIKETLKERIVMMLEAKHCK